MMMKKKTLDAQDVLTIHQTRCAEAKDALRSCCAHDEKALRMVRDEVRMMRSSCC